MPAVSGASVWRASFFVLRAPLLPARELEALTAEPDPAAALRALVARPEVREALRLASPDLDRGIDMWREAPNHPDARRVPAALYRYLARMAWRATPFGLFAGSAVGEIGERTTLTLSGEGTRHTRLDTGWLTALADALERELGAQLPWRVNDTLYPVGDTVRYAVTGLTPGTGERRNDLVSLTRTPAVDAVLAAAPAGVGVLTEAVLAAHPEVPAGEARDFVDELIAAGLLQGDLRPAVTAEDPLGELAERVAPHLPAVARALGEAGEALRALDAAGIGRPPEDYDRVTCALEGLPAPPDPRRLFHVDFHGRGDLRLGPTVLRAISDARDVLSRITPWREEPALVRFREAFLDRWGGGERPLVEVLDGERGVGFAEVGADPAPLLAGLPFPERSAPGVFGARERRMLRSISRCGAEWVLGEADLDALAVEGAPPLPDSHAFFGTIVATDTAAVDRGDFRLLVTGFGGPSGARLLGRFCLGDPRLREHVQAHLRAEENLAPDAVFAEIVHLPEGREGNVLARPRLREFEIPFVGRGTAPDEHRLPVTDLRVSVVRDRVILRSARLDREVIPRLTSAHWSGTSDLPIYRFLDALSRQGVRARLGWDWGALDALPFLPRVRWRNLVLSPARWTLDADDLRLGASVLRERRGLPRHVRLVEHDNVLPLDLEHPLGWEVLAAAGRRGAEVVVREREPEGLPVEGPAGRHTHEIVVPFVREAPREERPRASRAVPQAFAPGSGWLHAQIYTGTLTCDTLLTDALAPLVARLRAEGHLQRWFFLRYADPDWHLRVRLYQPPDATAALFSPLREALEPWLADGAIWRLTLDTYRPEVDRYGGAVGLPLSERLFEADSEAVLSLVGRYPGDDGLDARWRLALRGVHLLFEDLGLPVTERIQLLLGLRAAYAKQAGVDATWETGLNRRFREERASLEPLVGPTWDTEHPLAEGFGVLARRSEQIRPLAEALRAADLDLRDLAGSYVHMGCNRLLRSDPNRQELVIYDFLARLYKSRQARRAP